MKKLGIGLLFILSTLMCRAQISISSANLPSSGDTFRFSQSTNLALNTTLTGANTAWDYTSLTASSQGVDAYKSFIQTPYFFYSQFFGAVGLKTADTLGFGILTVTNVHTFYRKRSSSYTAEGTGFVTSGVPLASDYSNSDRVYKLPLKYNQHDTDNFRVSTSIPTLGSFIQQGTRINHVDGWGKISTPYKNNVNCLRIKSDVLETDSLKTQFVSFGFPVNRREIKWLSNTEDQPMLEITGPVFANIFTPSVIKYRDSVRSTNNGNGFGPRVSFNVNKTVGIKDKDTFSFTNTTTPNFGLTYAWSFTPNNFQYVNGTSGSDEDVDVVFMDTGWYDVKLSAERMGNTWDTVSSALIHIDNTSSVVVAEKFSLFLVPNPVTDYIYLQSELKDQTIKLAIYNIQGQLQMEHTVKNEQKINIKALPKGRYLMMAIASGKTVRFVFDKY